MSVITTEHNLTTTAQLIVPAGGANPSDLHQCLLSAASATIYIGGDDVTAANGFPVLTGETVRIPLSMGDDLYAVSSAPATVRSLITRT